MRPAVIVLAAIGCLTLPMSARAGLYIPGEPPDLVSVDGKAQALPFDVFRLKLHNTIGIAVKQPESELRRHYLQKRDELLAKGVGQLSVEELIRLSGYCIRLRENERALEVLHAAARREPRNFQAQSNLALLAHIYGRADAAQTQLDVIQLRPRELAGMSNEQVAWLLRVERALFDVQKARLKERKERGDRVVPETVDQLFPAKFVGESGNYEAGSQAAAEKAKLPEDALALVQQLLVWLPDDARLYWLLAELYNAQGDLAAAATIFDECIDARRFQTELLREHRRIVKDALAARQPPPADESRSWRRHPEVFWMLGAVAMPVLAFLVYWQVREIRRRWAGKAPARH